MVNKRNIEHYFKIGESIKTGGEHRFFQLISFTKSSIIIKTKVGGRIHHLSYKKLNILLENFNTIPQKNFSSKVYNLLIENGDFDSTNESYLYGLIKEYVGRKYDLISMNPNKIRKFKEGGKRLINHLQNERNQKLIYEAKTKFKKEHGTLFCESCKLNKNKKNTFIESIIEAHHKFPLSVNKNIVQNTVNDIIMLCPNCHRLIHRYLITNKVDEIKTANEISKIISKMI